MELTCTTAAILAGGTSQRMGGVRKQFIQFRGQQVLAHIHHVLHEVFTTVNLVTLDSPEEYAQYHFHRIISDQYLGKGPLAGIHAALKSAPGEVVFISACDTPLLDPQLIRQQLSLYHSGIDTLVPRHPQGFEPLHAIYGPRCLDAAEKILETMERPRILELLHSVNTLYWETSYHQSFCNFNTMDDLRSMENH